MEVQPVIVHILYQAQPGKADAVRGELDQIIAEVVKREPDCQGITLLRDVGDPHLFLLYERWTSQEAFTGPHMQTPHIQAFIQRAMGLLTGPPAISFLKVLREEPR